MYPPKLYKSLAINSRSSQLKAGYGLVIMMMMMMMIVVMINDDDEYCDLVKHLQRLLHEVFIGYLKGPVRS